jgi:hypothetical protein
MTLQSNKVRPQIRQRVVTYQNECDDVLWAHWLKEKDQAPVLALEMQQAADFTGNYLARCRREIIHCGGALPAWDALAEHRVASGMAALLLKNKRWPVTFHENGEPQMLSVPQDAAVFTQEKMLSWIQEHDGAPASLLPRLLSAVADRLKLQAV